MDYAFNTVTYGGPVMMLVGTLGNIFAIVVITHSPTLKKKPMGMYLIALAVVDTLMLNLGLVDFITYVQNVGIRDMNKVACHTIPFAVYFLAELDAWILASMSVDRCVAVFAPIKAKFILTRRRAGIGLFVTALLLASGASGHIWGVSLQRQINNGTTSAACDINPKHWYLMGVVIPWVDMAMASLIPFLIMLVTSLAIIFRIMWSNRKRKIHLMNSSPIKVANTTRILMVLTISFFILSAPVDIVLVLLYAHDGGAIAFSEATIQALSELSLWSNIIIYFNYVINFYLYCLASKPFRQGMKTLLTTNRVSRTNRDVAVNRQQGSTGNEIIETSFSALPL